MIPLVPCLLVLYFTGRTFSLFYFTINFILALGIYSKCTKFYFPDMSDTHNQNFHENYETFERDELHMISLIKIYHGMLNYFWFKLIGASICYFFIWVGIA